MTSLSFSDVPGFPNLFLDYVNEFESVRAFYPADFRDTAGYETRFARVSEASASDLGRRRKVADMILEGYNGSDPGSKTRLNIAALKSPDCIAVITGQQLGILGGPLYTTYKIITAIKLAASLRERYPRYTFVPVFWLEADDHDYDEVRSVTAIDAGHTPVKTSYTVQDAFDTEKGAVGELAFTEEISRFFEQYRASLKETEFTAPLLERLQEMYRAGRTFKAAFRDVLFELFDEYGLVIFDPQAPAAKEIVMPLFIEEVNNYQRHALDLIDVSASLEEVYHAQVKVKSINLFYHYNNGRYAIEPGDDDGFRLRHKRLRFGREELIALIQKHPAKFSPNVLLRPLCQDYLLPAGFYVAGPSEICYFAQAIPLYRSMGLEPPPLFPRASVTLLEKHLAAKLQGLSLSLTDLFTKYDDLRHSILKHALGFDIDSLFGETEKKIVEACDTLTEQLRKLDTTTADAGQRYKVKLISALAEYKQKALHSEERKHEAVTGQLQKIRGTIYPSEKLQERVLHYYYFANKYGPGLLKHLFDSIDIFSFEHQVIEIG